MVRKLKWKIDLKIQYDGNFKKMVEFQNCSEIVKNMNRSKISLTLDMVRKLSVKNALNEKFDFLPVVAREQQHKKQCAKNKWIK